MSSGSTALYGIRNFFRKRFGQSGGVQQDDVFLFGLDDAIGNATSASDENTFDDNQLDPKSTSRSPPIDITETLVDEAYINPGPRRAPAESSGAFHKSTEPRPSADSLVSTRYNAKPRTSTTIGVVQPPTSTFLVQASEVLWASMAAAAEKTLSQPTNPTPKVRSSNLRLKRWLPPDFDEPQRLPAKLNKDNSNKINLWNANTRNQKYQSQYRDMLQEFSMYTKRDVSHIPDPRMRTIFEGIIASFSVPEILRAFEILYEDYPPLRYGGKLIYKKLKATMTQSQQQRQNDISKVEAETGWSSDDIDASRIAFLRMAIYDRNDDNHSISDEDEDATRPILGQARFTLQQLIDYDLSETVVEMLGYDYFESFMQDLLFDDEELEELDEWLELNIDPKKKGRFKFAFTELMVALQKCPLDSIEPECDPATILQEIYSRLQSEEGLSGETTTARAFHSDPHSDAEKDQKCVDRFDAMVDDFLQWKDRVSLDRKGRKMDILRGCFAGADRKEIIDALRIVYVDYKPLRFAGDLIFKIMRAVVMSGMA